MTMFCMWSLSAGVKCSQDVRCTLIGTELAVHMWVTLQRHDNGEAVRSARSNCLWPRNRRRTLKAGGGPFTRQSLLHLSSTQLLNAIAKMVCARVCVHVHAGVTASWFLILLCTLLTVDGQRLIWDEQVNQRSGSRSDYLWRVEQKKWWNVSFELLKQHLW